MAIVVLVIAVVAATSGVYLSYAANGEDSLARSIDVADRSISIDRSYRSPSSSSTPAGGIVGIVTDEDGNPVVGMRVCIVSGTSAFPEIAVETNEEGYYLIGSVPPGMFEVAVHDRQGNRVALESVVVRDGEPSKLNFVIATCP